MFSLIIYASYSIMPGNIRILGILVLLLAGLGGCASTPQAGRQEDAAAKQFHSEPATSVIYVYRADMHSDEEDTDLYVDGRLIGATLPGSYFRVDVNPGVHRLNGMGPDQGSLTLETRPGQVYFVNLSVLAGNSYFSTVAPKIAQASLISCCDLLENWAPGQRPLLR